jgi:hypothetical protein
MMLTPFATSTLFLFVWATAAIDANIAKIQPAMLAS